MKFKDLFIPREAIKDTTNAFSYEKKKTRNFKIYEVSKQRITPAIDDYINAIERASSKLIQMRVTLYDNYLTTLMVDNHVSSLLEKRLENITNKTLVLVNDDDEEIEDVSYFLSSPKFREFTKELIMTKFWGFQLFEFDKVEYNEKDWFDYEKIPHKHVNPYRKEVLKYQTDDEGVSFDGRNDVMFVGGEDDLGLLAKVTLLSLYRRLGLYSYSKYLDLASENFTTMKVRGYADDDNMDSLASAIEKRSGGGFLEVPDGVDLNMENQSSTSQNALFENYMKMVKEELTILILGQLMTTEDGSSRSQAEVHEREQASKYSSDEVYVMDILNFEFIDYLNIWFPQLDTKKVKFKFEPANEDELIGKLQVYKGLKELGIIFTDEELRETFGNML